MLAEALKAKRIFPARDLRIDQQIETALSELRKMNERYHALKVELRRQVDWQPLEARVKETRARYEKEISAENLQAWMLAELALERAREILGPLYRRVAYGDEVQQRFASEFPDWKKKLLHAATLRLEKSKRDFETIRQQERERLRGENFNDEQIAQSPVVRRAQSVVDSWQYRIKCIETDLPVICWTQNVEAVLKR